MESPLKFDPNQAHIDFEKLCHKHNVPFPSRLDPPTIENYDSQINHLSSLALNHKYMWLIQAAYRPLFIDIVARWISNSHVESVFSASKQPFKQPPVKGFYIFLAICRGLHTTPEILPLVHKFISTTSIVENFQKSLDKFNKVEVLQMLVSIYRLLQYNDNEFLHLIPVQTCENLLEYSYSPVKYLAIQLLGAFLKASEQTKLQMIQNHIGSDKSIQGQYDDVEEVDYFFLPSIEGKRIALELNTINETTQSSTVLFNISNNLLSPLVANLAGVLVAHPFSPTYDKSRFVATDGAVSSIEKIAMAIHTSKPVLLTGEGGSGKTFYLEEIAKYLSRDQNLVRIHLGDQSDVKILVGTYSVGSKPGSFEWRPGVLTVAVQEGRWVLIEDIDKAPTDILSILLPLLEKRELLIPSRGETIKAANGFQIFGTVRTIPSTKQNSSSFVPEIIGKRLWYPINVTQPSVDELKHIIKERFPLLLNFADKFVDTYTTISQTFADPKFISLNKSSQSRLLTSKDLIKWSQRVTLLLQNNDIKDPNQALSSSIYDHIFAEAVDCFTAFIPHIDALNYMTSVIGQCLDVPAHRVSLYIEKHVPQYFNNNNSITVGRALVQKKEILSLQKVSKSKKNSTFANTNHSLRLLEKIGVSVSMREPVLLVGETGTGKTTVVQHLASLLNRHITVINVSQQTESSDLLGGYKPIDTKTIAVPIKEEFDRLFEATFSSRKNEKFFSMATKFFIKSSWKNVVTLWKEAVKMALVMIQKTEPDQEAPKKRRKISQTDLKELGKQWNSFSEKVQNFEVQVKQNDKSFLFSFVEGSLVQAIRRGDWVLLDEVNLAPAETLETIADLITDSPSITLSEKGDAESIKAHPDFRLFACMNPATDIGKRDLPAGLRSRFTELYVHSPDNNRADLESIISKYIGSISLNDARVVDDVAELYLTAKQLSESNSIVDGANQRPHFSIRTLSRTLTYAARISPVYGLRRSLYEGFCMSFSTLLDKKSTDILLPIIEKYTILRLPNHKSVMSKVPEEPKDGASYIAFKHYWLRQGSLEPEEQPDYIITPYVEKNLLNLTRAAAGDKFPILIQGPTSSGKTSMINYLAKKTGHKFVRINNHEHTDLQEYLGSYVSDNKGKLSFQEGVLVTAVRNGYWIVLDELNLAPTDVLEALNRLLDDNRELFIPETQEIVKPHPDFMIFATQNPPGLYGGRKVLSRAFRNRFLELHFDDIPVDELEDILRQRCKIAPSYSKKIVEVYRQLSIQRQSTRVFEQKNSFATLRDLFRWAGREAIGYEQLAANGYMLLAERVRKPEERKLVKQVLEKVMKVKLDIDAIYQKYEPTEVIANATEVVWTKGMRKLACLVHQALQYNEPVLLVGETGCGKTTICQVLAHASKKSLHIINAHQNTETGDIIGSQRPVRNRSEMREKLLIELRNLFNSPEGSLEELEQQFNNTDKSSFDPDSVQRITDIQNHLKVLFEWADGSLIQSLKSGDFFLLDEISLADDSVLERLNSVLEPERTILLAEKGSSDNYVTAADGFQFFATMNPGGDYGKKELSPALRNRFTEIWVPSMEDMNDVLQIIESKLTDQLKQFSNVFVDFAEWIGKIYGGGDVTSGVISLRDMLAWVDFSNKLCTSIGNELSILHGASMVFIDSIGTNSSASLAETPALLKSRKLDCVKKLSELLKKDLEEYYLQTYEVKVDEKYISVGPFSYPRNPEVSTDVSFNLQAPTTAENAMRVLRGMQVKKPLLLEGSPGVGKTSLITAIAEVTGHKLTRINLSEQTDLIDLFGSDSPAEGEGSNQFVWRDAPFLHAMQAGEWVLLDEMNLASQSVLEGLNACLDHRGETYIPELDRTFKCHPNFTVFAAQNPQYQGGGRKGLPKSFINRFTVVYMDVLSLDDLKMISGYLYPQIPSDIIDKMIAFIQDLDVEVAVKKSFGHLGSPYEFNLRDTMRWLKLLADEKNFLTAGFGPQEFIDIIAKDRFRTIKDREFVEKLYTKHFGSFTPRPPFFQINEKFIQSGHSYTNRLSYQQPKFSNVLALQCNIQPVETSLTCINNAWPLIVVGPTNSGKTSLIRYLAKITGSELEEFAMNGDIDSMDLLGGFDQVDLNHKSFTIIQEIKDYCFEESCKKYAHANTSEVSARPFVDLLTHIENMTISHGSMKKLLDVLTSFIDLVPEAKEFLEPLFVRISDIVFKLSQPSEARFEWFDGTLLKAVETGKWLVLDNANLCNPSVLDRLNSLLEPNGSLIVNECSLSNGEPRVVKPHKNFRLFMTMDSKYGELSRAMRNRGVELFLDSLSNRATSFDSQLLQLPNETLNSEIEIDKQLSLLSLKSSSLIPSSKFIPSSDAICRFFSLLEDANFFSETVNSFLTSLEISFIPEDYLIYFSRWLSNISKLPIYNEDERSKVLSSYSYLELVIKSQYKDALDSFYIDSKIPKELQDAQMLNPVLNKYVSIQASQSKTGLKRNDLAAILYIIPIISEIEAALNQALENSKIAKPSTFSYLDQSVANESGRIVKNSSSIKVFSLIKGISQFSQAIITQFLTKEVSDLRDSLFSLILLLQIAIDLIKLTSKALSETDTSRFPVYRDILDGWIEKYGSQPSFSTQIDQLNADIQNFSRQLDLTTGHSMNLLWTQFHQKVPSSKNSWDRYKRIQAISQKFDYVSNLLYSNSLSTIRSLQSSLLMTIQAIINSSSDQNTDLDEIIEKLETGIETLQQQSANFEVQRHHYFTDGFSFIGKSLELFVSVNPASKEETVILLKDIAYNAQYATFHLADYTKKDILSPYPPLFDVLWNFDGSKYASMGTDLVNNKLGHLLIQYSNTVDTVASQDRAQAVIDFQTLTSTAINYSDMIIKNHLSQFTQLFYVMVLRVIGAHGIEVSNMPDTATEFNDEMIQTLSKSVLSSTDDEFKSIFTAYFVTALMQFKLSKLSLARSWILFSIGMMKLYVPNIPFDPAIHQHVLYDRTVSYKSLQEDIISSWKYFKSVLIHPDLNEIEKIWESYLPQPTVEKIPLVYRPTSSKIGSIFNEWHSLLSSIPEDLLISLIDENASINGRHDQIRNIQRNTTQFINRMNTNFREYSDISSIFHSAIYFLKLGLDIFSSIDSVDQFNPYSLVDPLTILNIENFENVFNLAKQDINKLPSDISNNLMLCFLSNIDLIQKTGSLSSEDQSKLDEMTYFTYRSFYYKWSLDKMRQESAEASKQTIFKDNSEEEVEEDFKRMFPDYEDLVSLDDAVKPKPQNVAYDLLQLYLTMFGSKHVTIGNAMTRNISFLKEFSKNYSDSFNYPSLTNIFPAIVSLLASTIKGQQMDESGSEEPFDFYHSSRPEETVKFTSISLKIKNQIGKYLELWPEHATLQHINSVCDDILTLPLLSPIPFYLVRLEQIYELLDGWEKSASKDYSVLKLSQDVAAIIISMRQLELSSWPKLFDLEEMKSISDMSSLWFHLYEVLIENISKLDAESIDQSYIGIVQSLTLFLSQSTYGQFNTRLELLKAFAIQAKTISNEIPAFSQVAECILNVVNFHHPFVKSVDAHLKEIKRNLKKEIKDIINLVRWKDTTVTALKISVKKSHLKLHKVVRKYRDTLSGSINSIIQNGLDGISEIETSPYSSYVLSSEPSYNSITQHLELFRKMPICKSRSSLLSNVEKTIESMHRFISVIEKENLLNFEEFAEDVINNMNRLRDETPKVLTEENKKEVSALRMQKGNLLTSTLKELRRAGLKASVRADIRENQALMSNIMSSTKSFSEFPIGKSNGYFYKILDLFPKLRNAANAGESDAPLSDVQRGLAIAENMLAAILRQRKSTVTVLESTKLIGSQVELLSSLSSLLATQDKIVSSTVPIQYTSAIVSWVPKLMKYAIEACENSNFLSKSNISLHPKVFSEISERFSDLQVRLKRFSSLTTEGLISESIVEIYNTICKELETSVESLIKWKQSNKATSFISDMAIQWMNQQLDILSRKQISHDISLKSSSFSLDDLDQKIQTLSKSIMVIIQNFVSSTKVEITFEDDGWFVNTQTKLLSYSRQLHQKKITKSIKEIISIASSISCSNPDEFYNVISLIGTFLPFAKEYQTLCEVVENKLVFDMIKTNKTSYVLMKALYMLATNGFCTPQEESKDENDETTGDGTGLGDGAGGKSNNDDVEQDEGLTEDAQTANKEQDDNDNDDDDDDDNAVEMEGDMAGELEDASDQDKTDDEEDDDDKDEDDIDEEVGDIDDLDPNALDEKMWDEEGEENQKEKKSDNMPQNSNGDNLQANEDDDSNEGDNNEESNENADQENDKTEKSEDVEEEEDATEQEDEVKQNDEGEQLENNVPESDMMDLPDDLNIDGENEDNQDEDDNLSDMEMDGMDEEEGEEEPNNKQTQQEQKATEDENAEDEQDIEPEEIDTNQEPELDLDNNNDQTDDELEEVEEGVEEEKSEENQDIAEDADEKKDPESNESSDPNMKDQLEGLDGMEEAENEDSKEGENAAEQQDSTDKGKGSSEDADQEEENLEQDGASSSTKPIEDETEMDAKQNDKARNQVEESMKQLGDALKEYYDRKNDIQDAPEKDEDENETQGANQNPDEFQHIDGESSANDTQALGSAAQDYHQKIDEDRAIEEEDQDMPDVEKQEDHKPANENIDSHEETKQGDSTEDQLQAVQSMVGSNEKNSLHEDGDFATDAVDEEDIEMMDDANLLADGAEPGFEPSRDIDEARTLWQENESIVQESALALTEQLRLILEPTLATKLRGDFKTGKRLNMKRIIPYIASQYKKDKIWMRRTKPSKRQYQVLISVDDSKSMAESPQTVRLAFQSIALIAKALTQLEAGQLAISRFGEKTQLVHPFERPFSSDSGAHVLQWFGFQQTKTDVKQLVEKSIKLFESASFSAGSHINGSELWKLQIIVSDGICESHETLKRLVRKAREEHIMMVFVIVDGINNQGSILEMKDVQYDPDTGDMKIERYLDHFPFEYYIIVKEIQELPNVLSLVLRQFFSEIAESS